MPAIEQPTNPTNPREPVHGEVQAIEEQEQGAPLPQEENTQAAPATPAPPVPTRPSVLTRGSSAEIEPPNEMPVVKPTARPSTREEQMGIALLGMGAVSPITRRLALALTGRPQRNVIPEVLPRYMKATTVEAPTETPVALMEQPENQGATAEGVVQQAAQPTPEGE